MSRNEKLDYLREEANRTYALRREARGKMSEVREKCELLEAEIEDNRSEITRLRHEIHDAEKRYKRDFAEYEIMREVLSCQIDSMRNSANYAHEEMCDAYRIADECRDIFERRDAIRYSEEGKRYEDYRSWYNGRVKELIAEHRELCPPSKSEILRLVAKVKEIGDKITKLIVAQDSARKERQEAKRIFEQKKADSEAANQKLVEAIVARQAEWYEVACGDCGGSIRVHVEWEVLPLVCPKCKEKYYRKKRARRC